MEEKTKIDYRELVYEAVRKTPKGHVSTYGTIAKYVKVSPRMVGWALHRNPDPETIPCHRVVDRNGKLAENFAFSSRGRRASGPGGWKEQKRRLLKEGVKFKKNGRVDLDRFGYSFK